MARSDSIEVNGVVTEVLPGTNFKVQLENGHIIDAYLSGKMRVHYVRVCEGDKVRVALSPYDLTRGRIIFRERN